MKAGLLLLLFSAPAMASNFATCILDKMPGSSNQAMHAAVVQLCLADHAAGFAGVIQGSGRGWLGFSSGNACTLKKAAGTPFGMSAGVIATACRCLYDEPNPFFKPDPRSSDPVMCAYSRIDRFLGSP